jgi:RNA polymerase sigma factor (sigma-70 family)
MAALFDRFQPLVRRLLLRYRTLPFAEDLPGEAYLAFACLVQRYDPERGIPFPSYIAHMLKAALHTVARRECRIRTREIPLSEAWGGSAAAESPDRSLTGGEGSTAMPLVGDFSRQVVRQQTLSFLLSQLTARQAYVVVHRALQGEEYAQIGAALGCSQGAVRFTYFAARRRLQQAWLTHLCDDS